MIYQIYLSLKYYKNIQFNIFQIIQIIHLFKELKEKLNLTLIFITHNLDLVKVLCDNVVVIRGGEVCEAGERDKIFSDPKDEYTKSLLTALKDLEE